MMINKRLINTISESKKYIAANVALQWLSLAANIVMMTAVTWFLAGLFTKEDSDNAFGITLTAVSVSYTHLDVYKRQAGICRIIWLLW